MGELFPLFLSWKQAHIATMHNKPRTGLALAGAAKVSIQGQPYVLGGLHSLNLMLLVPNSFRVTWEQSSTFRASWGKDSIFPVFPGHQDTETYIPRFVIPEPLSQKYITPE